MIIDGYIEGDPCHCPSCSPQTNDIEKCWICGHYHEGMCPLVSTVEYFRNGNIKKMVFRYPAFPWDHYLVK